jgi:hypothetical protein
MIMMHTNLRYFWIFIALLFAEAVTAQCQYRLILTDLGGNGWEPGSVVTVFTGAQSANYSLIVGSSQQYNINVQTGDSIRVVFNGPFFDAQAGVEIRDVEGNVLYANTGFFGFTTLYAGVSVCPACPKPQNFQLEDVWDKRARFRWTPSSFSMLNGWMLIYGPRGFIPGPDQGDTLFVSVPRGTITGLEPYSEYDAYLEQQCTVDTVSERLGPIGFRTYRTNDVGICGVLTPVGGCKLGFEPVEVLIQNYGAAPQSLIPLNYSVNGIPAAVSQPQDGFYTGILGKDSCKTFVFDALSDFSQPGEYVIKVFTEFEDDENTANDTFTYYLAHQLRTPYQQNFEQWSGGWVVDSAGVNSSWAFGQPAKQLLNTAANGLNVWATSLTQRYNANERSYLISPCFNFEQAVEDPVIELSVFRDLETFYDGAFLDLSTDDGATWSRVGSVGSGLNWYTENNLTTDLGPVWSGSSSGWIPARNRLTGAAGSATVRLRFGLGSDAFIQREGFAVDGINIRVPVKNDLAAIAVSTIGENSVCGLEKDQVRFTIANYGTVVQSAYALAYSINGGPAVLTNVPATSIDPDKTAAFVFDSTFDSRFGYYEIKCWTVLPNEEAPQNDTVLYTVDHRPIQPPVVEDFEAGVLPPGWNTANMTITNGHNNASQVLASNLYAFSNTFTATSEAYGPLPPRSKIRFDYRITDFPGGTQATTLTAGDKFDLRVSSDCAASFITAFSITSVNHTPSTALKTVDVDLSAFEDMVVVFRFAGFFGGAGDYWFDLDNINVVSCPEQLGLSAETISATQGNSDGSATVTASGGTAPYLYAWSNGQSGQLATGLAVGEYDVTVTDALGCVDAITVTIGLVGVQDIPGMTRLSVRPNPTLGEIVVRAQFEDSRDVHAEIVDLLGRRVAAVFAQGDYLDAVFDLSNHPNGMYLLRLTADGRTAVRKVVKKN